MVFQTHYFCIYRAWVRLCKAFSMWDFEMKINLNLYTLNRADILLFC